MVSLTRPFPWFCPQFKIESLFLLINTETRLTSTFTIPKKIKNTTTWLSPTRLSNSMRTTTRRKFSKAYRCQMSILARAGNFEHKCWMPDVYLNMQIIRRYIYSVISLGNASVSDTTSLSADFAHKFFEVLLVQKSLLVQDAQTLNYSLAWLVALH